MNLKLLKELCITPGTSGHEENIRKIVRREIEKHVDEITIDNMGNLIALKKGKSDKKRSMVAAHMDEIGFIITHINKDGFARFTTIGGFDPKTLTAQRVIAHGKKDIVGVMGSKPKHLMRAEEMKKMPEVRDFFIDFGLSGKEVEKILQPGDTCTRERDLIEMGDNVCTKSLDNRVSVYVLCEALKAMKKPAYDFYAVFTVQEEVGLRGAMTSSFRVAPDFAFALDVTVANDVPGAAEHELCTKLGAGAAVKVMDSSVICDTRMVKYMEGIAKKKKIKTQREVLTGGGTDAGAMQRAGVGAITGAISIPSRYIHSVVEMANKKDIDDSVKLLAACVEGLDGFSEKY